jgi:hypothetical protein
MPGKVLAFQRLRSVDCQTAESECGSPMPACTKHDCAMYEPANQSRSRSYVDVLADGTIRYSLRVQDRRELLRLISACQIMQDRLVAKLAMTDPE